MVLIIIYFLIVNSYSKYSCFSFQSAGIIGVHHHAQLHKAFFIQGNQAVFYLLHSLLYLLALMSTHD
jgi:hypothetical protein